MAKLFVVYLYHQVKNDLKILQMLYCFFFCFFLFFFLYIQFTLFQTKNLQSPGTYISKRNWDPSQKAITK